MKYSAIQKAFSLYVNNKKQCQPAQHRIWLCGKNRRINNKSSVIYYKCYSLRGSYVPSSLFYILIYKNHFSSIFAAPIGTWLATVSTAVPKATGTIWRGFLRSRTAWSG